MLQHPKLINKKLVPVVTNWQKGVEYASTGALLNWESPEDVQAFSGYQLAVCKNPPQFVRGYTIWELTSGAVVVKSPAKKRALAFFDTKIGPRWEQYRQILALRILARKEHTKRADKPNPDFPVTDEIVALATLGKFNGFTYKTTTKDITL